MGFEYKVLSDLKGVYKMSAATNARTSRIAKTPRPVESIVEERIAKQETAKLVGDVLLSREVHFTTVDLTKKLFRCNTQSEVDEVIHVAVETSVAFNNEHGFGKKDSVYFDLRIRNAELIVRKRIEEGNKIKVNPHFRSVIVELAVTPVDEKKERVIISRKIDSWGGLTNSLSHGFRLVEADVR